MSETGYMSLAQLFPMGPDAAPVVEFQRKKGGSSGGSTPGYAEPFDIKSKTATDITLQHLDFSVGEDLYIAAGDPSEATVALAAGVLYAKIDTGEGGWAFDSLGIAGGSYPPDTEDGQYTFKPLYLITGSAGAFVVARDLRHCALSRWS